MVIGQYSKASLNNGCWMVGVSKVEEYDDFPDWKIMTGYYAEVEYSSELVIEIPDGFFDLEWYRNGERVED